MTIKILIPFILLTACGTNTDSSICDCLKAGDKLNNLSSELLTREVTKEDEVKMKELKSAKNEKCKDFQSMDGKKMIELKKECEE